jgi:hypothetical protein
MNFVNVSVNHVNIYNNWNRTIVRDTHNYVFNSWHGREWSQAWGNHFNPYSSRAPARETPGQFHAFAGNIQARPEMSRPEMSGARRFPHPLAPTSRDFAARPSVTEPLRRPSMAEPRNSNNLYSDRGGNVYRFNPAVNSWERNFANQWRSASPRSFPEFNRQAYGRGLGEQRFNVQRSFGHEFERRRGF